MKKGGEKHDKTNDDDNGLTERNLKCHSPLFIPPPFRSPEGGRLDPRGDGRAPGRFGPPRRAMMMTVIVIVMIMIIIIIMIIVIIMIVVAICLFKYVYLSLSLSLYIYIYIYMFV